MSSSIDVAGLTLVHFLWQGAIIGALAAAALQLLGRASAQVRYAVGCIALLLMLGAPVTTALNLSGGMAAVAPAAAVATEQHTVVAVGTAHRIERSAPIRVGAVAPYRGAALPAVVAVWLFGVCCLVVRLAIGCRRIRQLQRACRKAAPSRWNTACARIAARLHIARTIHVVDSDTVETPLVIGWLTPVIVLPAAALCGLAPTQIEAILAHELAHIRRHDFVVNVLQTIAETLFFYHPAVWWVSARVRIEREHCCDDVAVGVCGDPSGYAEALAAIEQWRADDRTLALAAGGGSLVERVRRLLGVEAGGRTPAATGFIVGVLTLACVGGIGLWQRLSTVRAAGRSGSAEAHTDFGYPGAHAWRMAFDLPSGQLTMRGFTGRDLVRFAFQVPDARVEGAPDWFDSEGFDLSTALAAEPSADEMPGIVRQLLEDRFSLTAHTETRAVPAYALVTSGSVSASGLRPAGSACFDVARWRAAGFPRNEGSGQRQVICGEWMSSPVYTSVARTTMAEFATNLPRIFAPVLDRPVIDRTGLAGAFDIDLKMFPPAAALIARYPLAAVVLEPLGFESLPAALEEQLGLRLEDASVLREIVVIDSVARPAAARPPA